MVAAWALGTGAAGAGAHPFNLEANGVDLIGLVPMDSISIEVPGPGTNGSMTFSIRDPDSTVTLAEWDEIRFIEWGAARPVLFGGFVQSVRIMPWTRATGRNFQVTCVGYGILLDKKVVISHPAPTTSTIGQLLLSLVNTWGGLIQGLGWNPVDPDDYEGSESLTVFCDGDWFLSGAVTPTALGAQTLRTALDLWPALAYDGGATTTPPVGWISWVDAYRRYHAMWDKTTDSGYEGTLTLTETTASETYGHLEYEREHTDKATAYYVTGGNANGTGMVRVTGHERAGDLEEMISISESDSAEALAAYGAGYIEANAGDPVRGQFVMERNTPIDVRPGQKLVATSTPLGWSTVTLGRITGVRISYQTSTVRRYEVAFGGRWTRPSAMSRTGRFAVRTA